MIYTVIKHPLPGLVHIFVYVRFSSIFESPVASHLTRHVKVMGRRVKWHLHIPYRYTEVLLW